MDESGPDFLQQELEALAGNAYTIPEVSANNECNKDEAIPESTHEPLSTTISRWQHLFSLDPSAAITQIQSHRHNLTRPRISDAHWEMIRSEKEAAGYDREAYEYELDLQKRKALLPDAVPSVEGSGVAYLVELTGPLEMAERVRQAAGMADVPVVVNGRSVEEGRRVELCCVDEAAKAALLRWAAEEGGGFEPTILVDPRSLR